MAMPSQRKGETGSLNRKYPSSADNAIAHRGRRLDIAVIGPGQNQHIGQEKGQQRGDSKPNGARGEDAQGGMQRFRGGPNGEAACLLHALAQQNIPQRSRDDHHQDEQKRFQVDRFPRHT